MKLNTNEKSGCEKFVDLIQLLLDNEADGKQKKYISDHIEECAPCLDQLEVEKEFRGLFKDKIIKKEVPADLINAIKTKIKSLV